MNASRLPIYNCRVDAKIKADGSDFQSLRDSWQVAWDAHLPDMYTEWHAGPLLIPQAGPHVFCIVHIDSGNLTAMEIDRLADDVLILVTLIFRDAKGTWWSVSSRGDFELAESPMKPRPVFLEFPG
jgi:hypothetical protein